MKRGLENTATGEIEAAAARWVARCDAGLSADESGELQRWIEADPRHRAALSFYDSAWSVLAKPARSGEAMELERQLTAMAAQRRRRRIAGAATALAVLCGIGLSHWLRPWETPEGPTSTAVVVLPDRQTLPDGSVVELKPLARISVEYTASIRRVMLLQGEAYFSVQKEPARPFVVSAGGVEVRAVGTEFCVQLNTRDVEVLVTDGKVVVDPWTDARASKVPVATAPLVALEAGKRVVMELVSSSMAPQVSAVPPVDLDERLAWRSPRLEFTRTPLGEAVDLLNQHAPASAARLAVTDASVAATRITGIFRADNTEAFVLLLEGAFGVKAERLGNTIALRKASAESGGR